MFRVTLFVTGLLAIGLVRRGMDVQDAAVVAIVVTAVFWLVVMVGVIHIGNSVQPK